MNDVADRILPLADRLARFFFLARRYGQALHAEDAISSGERAILRDIEAAGTRSVPELISGRAITRQAIQKTVDLLVERGAVAKTTSDHDLRSKRLALTREGQVLIRRMSRREVAEAAAFENQFSKAELDVFESVLSRIELIISHRTDTLQAQND